MHPAIMSTNDDGPRRLASQKASSSSKRRPAEARHRRELTTRQRLNLAFAMLGAVATVAAIGVFGGTVQTQIEVLDWLLSHDIGLTFAAWAIYAIPVAAFTVVVAPLRFVVRVTAGLVLLPGLWLMAVMGRPRGMSTAAWQGVLSIEYVSAAETTAYTILAVLGFWAAYSTFVFLHRSSWRYRADDALLRIRRNGAIAGAVALAASAVIVAL